MDQYLSAYYEKDSLAFWISRRGFANPVQVATIHISTWYWRTSWASRFNSSEWVLRIRRSRASRLRRFRFAKNSRRACSSTAERLPVSPTSVSSCATRSSESVTDVLTFILLKYYHPSRLSIPVLVHLPMAVTLSALTGKSLRWSSQQPDRRLIARKCDYTDKRPGPGRPGVMRQIAVNNEGSGESCSLQLQTPTSNP